MSRGLNQVTLMGNLVDDPRVFETKNGKGCRFRLAANYGPEKALFLNCVIFDGTGAFKQAALFAEHKKKGDQVLVSGQLENDDYEKDGVTQRGYTMTVRESVYLPRAAKAGDGDAPF